MTIDELARRAGTTTRTVRAYQERGLLPPPVREGRVGVYDEGHLARLLLIASLLERGFSLASIRALLDAWEAGHSVRDVLGLEEALVSLDDPEPVVLSAQALADRFGGTDAAATNRAIALGLLEPVDGGFLVTAPQLLDIGAELVALGIPVSAVLDETTALLADADRIADRFVGLFVEHVAEPALDGGLTDAELQALADKVRTARPLAARAVDRTLARAMTRRLADAVAQVLGADQAGEAAS